MRQSHFSVTLSSQVCLVYFKMTSLNFYGIFQTQKMYKNGTVCFTEISSVYQFALICSFILHYCELATKFPNDTTQPPDACHCSPQGCLSRLLPTMLCQRTILKQTIALVCLLYVLFCSVRKILLSIAAHLVNKYDFPFQILVIKVYSSSRKITFLFVNVKYIFKDLSIIDYLFSAS